MELGPEPIRKSVMDTGPLLSAITLEFVRRHPTLRDSILTKSRLEPYLKSPVKQESFLELFGSIETILTTSHVVAELHGLRFLDARLQKEFWQCAVELLSRKEFDER